MTVNGHDPAVRDLRGYRIVRNEELTMLAARWRFYFQRAGQRQRLLEYAASSLRRELEFERSLLTVAVHDLALASNAKDPQQFVRRWDTEHRAKYWGDE